MMTTTMTLTTPTPTDIGSQLDALPVTRAHRRIVIAIGMGLFFEVYEIFLSSSIAMALKNQYHLGGTTVAVLMASSFLGMFIGAAAFGRIADRIGRRKAFLLNLIWFSACSLLGALAPNPALLVAARFLAGIGIGAEYPVADSYLSDVLPKAHRGRLAAWTYTCSFLAVPALGFLSLGLSDDTVLGVEGWRVLLLIGAVGAVFVMLARRGLPESPRWLMAQGRTAEAEAALRTFAAGSGVVPQPVTAPAPCAVDKPANPIARLGQRPYRDRLAMLAVFHLFQPFGYYGFGTMAALVLATRGFDVTSSLLFTALTFVGYPLGSLISIPLLARFERKTLVVGSAAAMAASGIAFAVTSSPALIVLFGVLTTAAANVFSNIYHVYQAEIFPSDVRATAVGWTYSLSRLSSAAIPFVLIPVLDAYGATAMFAVVVAALAASLVMLVPFGPRTTGRSVEEINPA